MSDPLDYSAKIKAKGLDNTGVTQAHAKDMAKKLGKRTLLIVEVEHDRLVTDADGHHQVVLGIAAVEPVPSAQEETVRRFMRALYMTRPEVAGQATLKGTYDEETPEQAAAGLAAAVETDDSGEVTGVWDGDPDKPLTPAPEDAGDDGGSPGSDEQTAEGSECPYPECKRQEGHGGPHRDGDGHVLGTDVDDEE